LQDKQISGFKSIRTMSYEAAYFEGIFATTRPAKNCAPGSIKLTEVVDSLCPRQCAPGRNRSCDLGINNACISRVPDFA